MVGNNSPSQYHKIYLFKAHNLAYLQRYVIITSFPGGTNGKELACQSRRCKSHRYNPWVRKTPGEGHGNPIQYSCMEIPMDRGAWWVKIHRVVQSQTWLKRQQAHTHIIITTLHCLIILSPSKQTLYSFTPAFPLPPPPSPRQPLSAGHHLSLAF